MRLRKEIAEFLREEIKKFLPDTKVYLFGSRVDYRKKGGDIDILVISSRKLTLTRKENPPSNPFPQRRVKL